MRMEPILVVPFVVAGSAACAEVLSCECRFTRECRGDGTREAIDESHGLELDTKRGTGRMVYSMVEFAGEYAASDELHHFVVIHWAGAEVMSIGGNGQATYSVHMTASGGVEAHRLDGACSAKAR